MTELDTRPTSARRSRKKAIWATIAVVAVIGVAVGLALFQPWRLFTRSTVDEALPVAAVAATGMPSEQPVSAAPLTAAPTSAPVPATREPEPGTAPASGAPVPATASAIEQPVPAPAEPAEPVVLASGGFVDGEHATTGSATVLQLPDGSRFVRLEGFSTSDGPDVHVWVTDQQAGGDDWGKYDDGRYLELGDLKGTDGNQNYALPADADLTGLTSVVIWCDRFNVAFGSAAINL